MKKMSVVCSYLISAVLFGSKGFDVPYSPCPQFFEYFRNVVWIGRLSVPVPRAGLPVVTKVFLSLKGALQSRYVGFIELADPVEIAVDNIVNWGANIINYTVRFPLPYPLPSLLTVLVNNVTVCYVHEPPISDVTTTLLLEHTFPANPDFLRTTDSRQNCGIKTPPNVPSLQVTGFGEWPWLAGILLKRPGGLEFHCTGNLLTNRHIISAAHCVKPRLGRPIPPRNFVVYLGKYDLRRWNEPNSQIRNVEDAVIHPDYLLKLYTSDLVILILSEPATFDLFVRPVCIWRESQDVRPYVGRTGMVVGWGKDSSNGGVNAEPRTFELPIVDQADCLRSRRDFFYLTSGHTLCAGLRNGTGPCNGDSGSGLVFPAPNSGLATVWFLRGVLSLSLLDPYKQTCDLTNYLVFTDLAKFADWIQNVVQIT